MKYAAVKRAYDVISPAYDFLFDRIFHAGRVAAVSHMRITPGQRVLEIGIGTGLNLPLYPRHCHLVGIDLSRQMLRKAQERVEHLSLANVTLLMMDATRLTFADDAFDHVLATYVISAVPDPVQVLREARRVCRPGGTIVMLNHFKSENPVLGAFEELVAPLTTKLGLFKPDLALTPLLEHAGLIPDQVQRVNALNGWRLVRCINRE
ncbi:MAG: methyltransferase domain-containing protein [candidate division NC10 bacterium]|nr:methyltransferase domain-containing protein [candidate division NC10 bacterium]